MLDSHELDYMIWLLGPVEEVVGMTAQSGSLEIETEDVAGAVLRFESGALATLQVDYIQRAYRRRYHLTGDEGTIEWDVETGLVRKFSASDKTWSETDCQTPDFNEMYVDQMRHVLNGVQGIAMPVSSLSHARTVLALQIAVKNGQLG